MGPSRPDPPSARSEGNRLNAASADHFDLYVKTQSLPDSVGCQHGFTPHECQGETGTIAKREAELPRRAAELARQVGLLRRKLLEAKAKGAELKAKIRRASTAAIRRATANP